MVDDIRYDKIQLNIFIEKVKVSMKSVNDNLTIFVKLQILLQCYIVSGQTKRKQIYETSVYPVSRGKRGIKD